MSRQLRSAAAVIALSISLVMPVTPASAAGIRKGHPVIAPIARVKSPDPVHLIGILQDTAASHGAAIETLRSAVLALQGAQAAGFNFRGAWSITAIYASNDVVTRNGSSYVAVTAVAGVDPGSDMAAGGRWMLVAQKGQDGSAGTAGLTGPVGATGAAGVAGPAGMAGAPGAPGAAGVPGPAGATGLTGLQGATGDRGPPGAGVLLDEDRGNTGVGQLALQSSKDGKQNTAIGGESLAASVSGNNNTASGYRALRNATGSGNIALGTYAGFNLGKGDSNIYLGNTGLEEDEATIRIGTEGEQAKTFIAGITGMSTDGKSSAVLIDQDGQLGTISSSRRYKYDIEPMAAASERLQQLRPVTFRYRKATVSGAHPLQYGLIAEEVAEVFPELVVLNRNGEPETVAYHLLTSLLLNELQKEHQLNVEHGLQLLAQQREFAQLREQLAQLGQAPAPAVALAQTAP
jgi:hypothetical protein